MEEMQQEKKDDSDEGDTSTSKIAASAAAAAATTTTDPQQQAPPQERAAAERNRRSRPGLDRHVQKELAERIEGEGGGIANFVKGGHQGQALSRLCNQDTTIFGRRGDPIRRQIQKYVCRWGKYHQEKTYTDKVLNRYGVQSAATRKKLYRNSSSSSSSSKNTNNKKDYPCKKIAREDRSYESDSDSSAKKQGAKPRSRPKASRAWVAPEENTPQVMTDLPRGTVHLMANFDKPEATYPFFVFGIDNIPGINGGDEEERYDGFSIQMKADIRWILEDEEVDFYTMHVWREDSILVKMPAFEYTLLHNKDGIDPHIGENLIDEMDDARQRFENNKSLRMFRYYLIQFPPGVVLSSKSIFKDAGDDEELDYEVAKIENHDDRWPVDIVEHWLHFIVARVDTKASKRPKVEKKKSKTSKAAGKVAAQMNMTQG